MSARYAERKRAAARARDALGRAAVKCSRPACGRVTFTDHICAPCRAEYERLRAFSVSNADAWVSR